jgi:hypothetical protein
MMDNDSLDKGVRPRHLDMLVDGLIEVPGSLVSAIDAEERTAM